MKSLPLTNKHFKFTLDKYTLWLTALGYSPSQCSGGPSLIKGYLYFLEERGYQHIRQSTSELIDSFLAEMKNRKSVRTEQPLSDTHINGYITELKRFGRFLWDSKGINIHTDHLKQVKVQRIIRDVLTVDEIKELFDQTDDTAIGLRDKAMLALYYGCGLRRSEGLRLNVDDVLLTKGLVFIRQSKNGNQRYVPISSQSMQHIRRYIEEGRPHFVRQHTDDALLINERGKRCEGQSINLRLKHLQRKSDIPSLKTKQIGLHSLRHSIATHLMANGMPFDRISQFLGHTSMESTQVYTHLAKELQ